MGSIALIRHAQASFFSDDYDQLSDHGRQQAKLLGEHWKSQGRRFTEVIVGPCRRHRQTAQIALAASGDSATGIVELPEFDEHQVDRLILCHKTSLAGELPELAPLVDALDSATETTDRARRFQILFEAITAYWRTGRVGRADIETWPAFQQRVNRGITAVLAGSATTPRQGRQVAVFSSVGPISVAFQRATGCSDESALGTGWRLRNCALTQALFSGDRFTLDTFNSLAHLPDPSDWTYR